MLSKLKNKSRERGFSLIELLIVIAIILIIMAVAIPSFRSFQSHANELSAIQSVKTLGEAELQYQMMNPQVGFTCNIPALGPGAATPAAEGQPAQQAGGGFISDTALLSGVKQGYVFSITNCTGPSTQNTSAGGQNQNQNQTVTSYQIIAAPITPGKTGTRYFCADSPSSVHWSKTPNCNPDTDPTI
jgi:type IV pilus assembly protein PilA